jgi:hypothetical protein
MNDFSQQNAVAKEREAMTNVHQNLNAAPVLDPTHQQIEYEVEGHPWASEEGCAPPMRRAHHQTSARLFHGEHFVPRADCLREQVAG